ncbi:amidase family protein [Povalibacter sp.]|uniref:amidase family protein n=1 Tax=Povalibacter sp. TaxID=1962978 RepID=UPI002F3E6BE5
MRYLRLIPVLTALLAWHIPQAHADSFDLSTATIADINAAFAAGSLNSERLVSLYLARIEAYDKAGPKLGSVINLNPHALEEARALDAERAKRGPRGPLHGIVVLAKDVFDTQDMPTTGGFKPLAASQPERDAFVIERLRAAGAIVLGKLNLADWYGKAAGSGSTLGGVVISPYNATKYPGASSSGSGVAAAAWLGTVTLGSDTGGSLVIPAALNAVVTIAPTRGLVSRNGMMWNSPLQEKAGPMTRSVYDAAAVLDAIAGYDPGDLTTAASFNRMPSAPYTSFVAADGLRGARIGVLREMVRPGAMHDEGRAMFERELAALARAGAIVVDPVLTGLDLSASQAGASTATYEQGIAADYYFSTLPPGAPIRSLDELLEKGGDLLEPTLRQVAALRSIDHHAPFLAAREQQIMLRDALVGLLDRFQLDALVLPYRTVTAPKQGAPFDAISRREMRNGLHAYTGLPTVLVPGGYFKADGMPFALQFFGREFSEPVLIRLASGYEAATHHRRAPSSTPALAGERFEFKQ